MITTAARSSDPPIPPATAWEAPHTTAEARRRIAVAEAKIAAITAELDRRCAYPGQQASDWARRARRARNYAREEATRLWAWWETTHSADRIAEATHLLSAVAEILSAFELTEDEQAIARRARVWLGHD